MSTPDPTLVDAPWTAAAPEAVVERALAILEQERGHRTLPAEIGEPGHGADHGV